MSVWVVENLSFLEGVVGKPAVGAKPAAAPAAEAPIDKAKLQDRALRLASILAELTARADEAGAMKITATMTRHGNELEPTFTDAGGERYKRPSGRTSMTPGRVLSVWEAFIPVWVGKEGGLRVEFTRGPEGFMQERVEMIPGGAPDAASGDRVPAGSAAP